MNKVGLYFGTFNPFHIGHFWIAKYAQYFCSLEEVWFIPSPQSPFKTKEKLLDISKRIHIITLSIEKEKTFRVLDIEKHLPIPSYTSITLKKIYEDFPNNTFSLILGQDTLESFHHWKDYTSILSLCSLIVYPRKKDAIPLPFDTTKASIIFLDKVPILSISSTMIKERISKGLSVSQLVYNQKINEYLLTNGLYK